MGVSKVVYGQDTLVDLTSDTVTSDTLVKGVTAHSADGEAIVGTFEGGGSGDGWGPSVWNYVVNRCTQRAYGNNYENITIGVGVWVPNNGHFLNGWAMVHSITGTSTSAGSITNGYAYPFCNTNIYQLTPSVEERYTCYRYTYKVQMRYGRMTVMSAVVYSLDKLLCKDNGDGTFSLKAKEGGVIYPTSYVFCVNGTSTFKYESLSNLSGYTFSSLAGGIPFLEGMEYSASTVDPVKIKQSICYSFVDLSLDDTATCLAAAFMFNQDKLKKVIMPPNLEKIDSYCFYYCTGLETIDFSNSTKVPKVETNAFLKVPSTCKFIVPAELYESWKTNSSWAAYANQIEIA